MRPSRERKYEPTPDCAARELNGATLDALEVDADRQRRGARVSSAPRTVTHAAAARRAGRAPNALAHQRIVRIFRQPRQRHGEQLVRPAVAIRREDERLSVGRQLAVRSRSTDSARRCIPSSP